LLGLSEVWLLLRRLVRLSTLDEEDGTENGAGIVQRRRKRLWCRISDRCLRMERCLCSYCCRCCLELISFLIFFSLKRSANDNFGQFWIGVGWVVWLFFFFERIATEGNEKTGEMGKKKKKIGN